MLLEIGSTDSFKSDRVGFRDSVVDNWQYSFIYFIRRKYSDVIKNWSILWCIHKSNLWNNCLRDTAGIESLVLGHKLNDVLESQNWRKRTFKTKIIIKMNVQQQNTRKDILYVQISFTLNVLYWLSFKRYIWNTIVYSLNFMGVSVHEEFYLCNSVIQHFLPCFLEMNFN